MLGYETLPLTGQDEMLTQSYYDADVDRPGAGPNRYFVAGFASSVRK